MTDLLMSIIASALLAVPITMGLGVVYFSIALGIVHLFRLNYGERPIGFKVLNCAVALTMISYFLVFAIALRRY
ncbi:hypothetical protein EBT16_11355 [bacterium]|nr:hypothetical protein [bacterium]